MISVVWLKHDLRIHDNLALDAAIKSKRPVVLVYTKRFNHKRYVKNLSPLREAYIDATLNELKKELDPYNIPLVVYENDIISGLKMLAETVEIKEVFTHQEASIFESDAIRQVKKHFSLSLFENHTLIHPDDLGFPLQMMPDSFTRFRKKVESRWHVRKPVTPVLKIQEKLPIDSSTFFNKTSSFVFSPGEKAGLKRLHDYLASHQIKTYKETRNGMLHFDDTTKFSFYISVGALSVKTIYFAIKEYEKKFGKNDSTYWVIFELLWRDFFKFHEMKSPLKMVSKSGFLNKNIDWNQNFSHLDAFKTGKTGYPLIDANILELLETGYMSNRGRQNVASFFVKNLGLDWQEGERFFEHHLLDYDLASNMGNWQYITGIGHDSMPFRYFDVMGQGDRYDKDHAYLLRWLPVLKKVDPKDRYHLPKLSLNMFEMLPSYVQLNYPKAIVSFDESLKIMKQKYGVL